MELAVIFFITVVGLGNEMDKTNNRVDELEHQLVLQDKWIRDLENWNDDQDQELIDQQLQDLKLVGAHSSFYAGQQLHNDATAEAIEDILKQLK